MPQTGQNLCLMACLLNVYVRVASSGVSRWSLSRGTNQSSEPRRWQIEQLHATAPLISPSTSNATPPQWQLPLYFMYVLLVFCVHIGWATSVCAARPNGE